MKKLTTIIATIAVVTTIAACKESKEVGLAEAPQPEAAAAKASNALAKNEVERGKYLVTTSGCHDCHTPLAMGPNGPAPDMTRQLSGHPESLKMPPPPQLPPGPWLVTVAATNTAWAGPWGVSFTANLTPDPETGIGNWSKQNFMDAIRNARHMGAGRPILPPMPAAVYANLTDEDLGSIYAYLRTVPAIVNKVPEPMPPMPPVVTTTAATLPAGLAAKK